METIVTNDSVEIADTNSDSEPTTVEGTSSFDEQSLAKKQMEDSISRVVNSALTQKMKALEAKMAKLLSPAVSSPAVVSSPKSSDQVDALLEIRQLKADLAEKDAKLARQREESSVFNALSSIGVTDPKRQKMAYAAIKAEELLESADGEVFFKTIEGNASIQKGLESWIVDNQFLLSPKTVQGTGTLGASKQQISAATNIKPKEITLGDMLIARKKG